MSKLHDKVIGQFATVDVTMNDLIDAFKRQDTDDMLKIIKDLRYDLARLHGLVESQIEGLL